MKLPGNLNMMFQAAQNKMKKLEEEVRKMEAEASAGGDMVTVRASGSGELLSVRISPEVVKGGDVEMLEDLVLSAANEAVRKVKELKDEKTKEATGGMDLSMLNGLM
jgi:nucleoid-associated protein EbfC